MVDIEYELPRSAIEELYEDGETVLETNNNSRVLPNTIKLKEQE